MMTQHVYNSTRSTCKCSWCNQVRSDTECPVDITTREQIEDFIQENGPQWKSKLINMWMLGEPVLQNVRNILGPSGIHKISKKLVIKERSW